MSITKIVEVEVKISGGIGKSIFLLLSVAILIFFIKSGGFDYPDSNSNPGQQKNRLQSHELEIAEQLPETRRLPIKLPDDPELLKLITDRDGEPLPQFAIMRLGTTRWTNGEAISSSFFSRDDRLLVTAGSDKKITWWDTATGRPFRMISCDEPIGSLYFYPNSGFFVSLHSFKPEFVFRNLETGKPFYHLIESSYKGKSNQQVSAFAFCPDQQMIAVQSGSCSVSLYSIDTFQLKKRLEGLDSIPDSIWFSENGAKISAVSKSGSLVRWLTDSGEMQFKKKIEKHDRIAVSNKKDKFAICDSSVCRIYSADNGDLLHKAFIGGNTLTFSPDDRFLVLGNYFGCLHIMDFQAINNIRTVKIAANMFTSISFANNKAVIAASDGNGKIRLHSFPDLATLFPDSGHQGEIKSLSFTKDGKNLLSVAKDDCIKLWDLTSAKELCSFTVATGCRLLRIIDDNRAIVSHNTGATVFDFRTGKVFFEHKLDQLIFNSYYRHSVYFSRDGSLFAAVFRTNSGFAERTPALIKVCKSKNGETVSQIPTSDNPGGIAFSPDNSRLALATSGQNEQKIFVYEVDSGREIFQMPIPTRMNYISSPVYSMIGQLIVGGGSYGEKGSRVVKTDNGEYVYFAWCMGMFRGQEMASPDGVSFADRDWRDNSIIEIGESPWMNGSNLKLIGHKGMVSAVSFSPGGKYLASGGQDSNIFIWNLLSGEKPIQNDRFMKMTPSEEAEPGGTEAAEAPFPAKPIFYLDFENEISSPGFEKLILADDASSHDFVKSDRGWSLSLSSHETRAIEYGGTKWLPAFESWTIEFCFQLSQEYNWETHPYLKLFEMNPISFVVNRKGNAVVFLYQDNKLGHKNYSLNKGKSVKSGVWHQIAVTWEKSSGETRLFWNGSQVYESVIKNIKKGMGALSLGKGSGSKAEEHKILFDDFKIFAYAKTPQQIASEAGEL